MLTHATEVKAYLLHLQQTIIASIEDLDQVGRFKKDTWQRSEGGGGISAALTEGRLFEQAGINFSHVMGDQLPASATATRPHLAGQSWEALGVSLVFHPWNPFVPSTHMNVRFFTAEEAWWFGGGFDLTPYYGFVEDCVHWHATAKKACDPFGPHVYPQFKQWADDYFYLKHRDEPRGIGGLFFDDWQEGGFERSFALLQSVGNHFMQAYKPLVERHGEHPFNEAQRRYQCHRRGRYVEFNLLQDRGTLFGLQSKGRTESILMSLPPMVRWNYAWQPNEDSLEAHFVKEFLEPRDWLAQNPCVSG